MSYSSKIIDYMGEGIASARPATLSIAPTALGLYYAVDTKVLSLWNGATPGWDNSVGPGSVIAVVAGSGLEVGAGPGGTITGSGTLNFRPIAAGLISSDGTIPEATTLGPGLSWTTGTLANAGVVSFGGAAGTVALGAGLSMSGQTLEVSAATVPGAGLVSSDGTVLQVTTLGAGIAWASDTLSNSGVTSIGGDAGSITIGPGLSEAGNTLSSTAILSLVAGAGVTITGGNTIANTGILSVAAGTGISFTGTDTIVNAGIVHFAGVTGDVTLGPNLSMSGQTLEVSAGAGGVSSIIFGDGLSGGTITSAGTAGLAAIAGGDFLANTSTASAVPTATALATITMGSGLSGGPFTAAAGGTATNAGVVSFGATTGAIALGANLSMTGNTLEVAAAAGGVVSIGGVGGTVALGPNLSMSGQTLDVSVPAATTAALGGIVIGGGLAVSGGTASNAGVLAVGGAAGLLALGTNLSVSGQTLNAASGLAAPAAGVVLSNGTVLATATLDASLNLTGSTLAVAAASNFHGQTITLATVAFGAGAIAANGTIILAQAFYPASVITAMDYTNGPGAGSGTVDLKIGTTDVTGLSAVVVNSTSSATASGANTIAAGNSLSLVLTGVTGTLDGAISIIGTIQ